jgi:hypothetical protein
LPTWTIIVVASAISFVLTAVFGPGVIFICWCIKHSITNIDPEALCKDAETAQGCPSIQQDGPDSPTQENAFEINALFLSGEPRGRLHKAKFIICADGPRAKQKPEECSSYQDTELARGWQPKRSQPPAYEVMHFTATS